MNLTKRRPNMKTTKLVAMVRRKRNWWSSRPASLSSTPGLMDSSAMVQVGLATLRQPEQPGDDRPQRAADQAAHEIFVARKVCACDEAYCKHDDVAHQEK